MNKFNRQGRFWLLDDFIDHQAKKISKPAQMIYIALSRHANKDGETFVSFRTIAKKIGVSKNTITKHFRILEASHMVIRLKQKTGRASHIRILPVPNGVTKPSHSLRPKEDNKEYIKEEQFKINPQNYRKLILSGLGDKNPALANKIKDAK